MLVVSPPLLVVVVAAAYQWDFSGGEAKGDDALGKEGIILEVLEGIPV